MTLFKGALWPLCHPSTEDDAGRRDWFTLRQREAPTSARVSRTKES